MQTRSRGTAAILSRISRATVAAALVLAACGGSGGGGDGGSESDPGIGLEDRNADGEIVILAFGDSITRGVGDGPEASDTPNAGSAGYPARLEALLGVQVDNEGEPGEETEDGVERLRRRLPFARADYVILLEGVNDIVRREEAGTQGNLDAMLGIIAANGALAVIGTLTPTCCDHEGLTPNGSILVLNDGIRGLSNVRQAPLIDFYEAFVPPAPDPEPGMPPLPPPSFDETSGLIHMPEGLHPTPAGYDLMAITAARVFLGEDFMRP